MPTAPTNATPTDQEKQAVWTAYRAGKPTRVPVSLYTNPRVVLMNREWNPDGVTFTQTMEDPETHVQIALRHELYRRQVLNRYADSPTDLPDTWTAYLMVYNIYEAAYLGAPVHYYDDQVPDTEPCFAGPDGKEAIFEADISRPAENPFIRHCLDFHAEMAKVCKGMTFEGRPVRLEPWSHLGSDGPVTVAMNLRGPDFMLDMIEDPEYADRLMGRIVQAAINRSEFFLSHWEGKVKPVDAGMADDSCAMLSPAMYAEQVLPHHRRFYESKPAGHPRGMHMCGDATRLFPIIREQLGVTSFDTGFPVDHGKLRDQLGEDVEILGGPGVASLIDTTPDAVYELAKGILQSGVMRGGRFILREGNNLPPNVPEENLAAMYQASLDFGQYDG